MKGWMIFVLVLVIYGVSVFGGFIQDDTKVIVADPQMGQASPLLASFTRPYYYMDGGSAGAYRPLTSFSFYLNALVTGKKAWGFHLVNVILYASACLLSFEVLKKYSSERVAFWGALVFIVLPIHTEVVNNIVGRAEMLSLGLVLVAILMQFWEKWEMSALMFFLALFSKETAIVGLPILVYLLILEKEKKDLKIGVVVFYFLVTISYLFLRGMVLGGGGMGNNATIVENPLKFVGTEQRVMNAFALVPFGVGKVIFPINLSYDYSFNQLKLVSSWFDWRVMLGISMMLLSIGSLFTRLRENRLWILGQAFFWGSIFITGNFLFPVGTIFGERLWFWSSLGLMLILIAPFNGSRYTKYPCSTPSLSTRRFRCARYFGTSAPFMLAIILIFAVRTFVRNLDWLSQDKLFIHDAAVARNSVMAQSNAAAMYLLKRDFVRGKELLEKADKIYPKYPELMNNWGMYYLWTGGKEKARERFEECLKEKSGYYLCESNLKLLK